MTNKENTTEHCGGEVATIGRFYEKDNDGNCVGDPIKIQVMGDVFPPHIRILRENDGLLACVRLDKEEYLPFKGHKQNLTDEQVNGLIDFFRSPSDFPLVRMDGVVYKLKTMWDYTIVSWNRECDDARLHFALQRGKDDYLIFQMPDYTKLNRGSALKKISYDDIDTYELSRVAKEDTGLNYDLMLDSLGKDRRGVPPHIFVCVGDELFPMLLSPNNNDHDGFADVQKYIRAYLSVLLAHYNKLLTDRQTLNLLRGVEAADDELVGSTLRKLGQNSKHMIDSKYLSFILRHAPSAANVELDSDGYVAVEKLINGIKQTGRHTDRMELEEIVAADSKRRFSFNDDHTKIRANYGHSMAVNLQMPATLPPAVLYHGTAKKFLECIAAEGIKKQSRNFVHLSDNPQTALMVGARHGQAEVLSVLAREMCNDGFSFYLSESGVWLTEIVPPKYVFQMDEATSDGCECPPFEMSRLNSRRTGIAGEIWVYDTGKCIDSSRYRIVYENANARVFVYFDGIFPRIQGDVAVIVHQLPQVILWLQRNKNFLLKLYRRGGNYDIVDFIDEMQPVSSPEN